ncbi:hypothetical protein [Marinobacter sp. R17]|uniref:hypothetical protein n=1 Tax=Marinobacter sp. R17 TaxID=2484250 RepID=UPI000F4AFB9F|nr:hypothetical protein [Marinobacter sp. R17]
MSQYERIDSNVDAQDEAAANAINAESPSLPESKFEADDQSSCASGATQCQQETFVSAIYVTGHQRFWLLTQEAKDAISSSAAKLKGAVAKEKASDRIDALKDIGLSDLFVPPTAKSFLPANDQKRWEELLGANAADQESIQEIDDEIDQARIEHKKRMEALDHGERFSFELQQAGAEWRSWYLGKRQEIHQLNEAIDERQATIDELRERGENAAKTAGFNLIEGQLFSDEQVELHELMQQYSKARQAYESEKMEDYDQTDIFLKRCRLNLELQDYEAGKSDLNIDRVEEYLTEWNQMIGDIQPYLESVLALANRGVAMPEYALANGQESVERGVLKLADHRRLDFEVQRITEKLEEEAEDWLEVLADAGPVPKAALYKYQADIDKCHDDQNELRRQAKETAERLDPPRLFVWNPNEFEQRPYKSLVKPGIPLREYSEVGGDTLQHFSILDLGGAGKHLQEHLLQDHPHYSDQPPKAIAAAMKAAQKPGDDKLLETLLTDLGCKPLSIQATWFDQHGLFEPEAFFESIAGERVDALQDAEARRQWGESLRGILFDKSAKRHITLLDESYTSQFMRLVLSGVPGDLGESLSEDSRIEMLDSLSGPDSSVKGSSEPKKGEHKVGYQVAEAKIGTNLAFRQGQIDLLDVKYPKPEKAEPIQIEYHTENGAQTLDIGRFVCSVTAKCWGFIGARIALSRSIGVEAVQGKGIAITGVESKEEQGADDNPNGSGQKNKVHTVQGAQLDAFAGGEAGVFAQTELLWAMPESLRRTETYRNLGKAPPEWLSVGLLNAELVGRYGVGANREFMLTLKKRRIALKVGGGVTAGFGGKCSLGFELALDTIPYWIRLLQDELQDNGYSYVAWIDPEAFEYLSWLAYLFLTTGLSLTFLAMRGYDFVETAFRKLNASERAGLVAWRLTGGNGSQGLSDDEYRAWFQRLQPEAIGPLLNHLVSEPEAIDTPDGQRKSETEVLQMQQEAIVNCLTWMKDAEQTKPESYRQAKPNTIQKQFEKSLKRMNMQGTKPTEDVGEMVRESLGKLDQFMQGGNTPESARSNQDYRAIRQKLAYHIK